MTIKLINGPHFITGPVDLTDISVVGGENSLIYLSEISISQHRHYLGNWYLHPKSERNALSDKLGNIEREDGLGLNLQLMLAINM